MHSVHQAEIDGDIAAVYRLVAEVDTWPSLFPHILGVDVLWRDGEALVARVRASRSGIPVRWICHRGNDRSASRVFVEHIDGFAYGLRATWELAPLLDGRTMARLTVDHHAQGLVGRWLDPIVVDYLATHTLAMLTLLTESDRAAHDGWDVGTTLTAAQEPSG